MAALREPDWRAVDEALADSPGGRNRTVELLQNYFAPVDWTGTAGFTGSAFETFDGGGDRPEVRERFTKADLVAVTLLGVNIPARAAVVLLQDADGALGSCLRAIPTDVALEDVDIPLSEAVPDCGPLYRLVDAIAELGQTKTSKLLARKRPRLIPVIDDVTWKALGKPSVIWEPLRRRLRDEGLAGDLSALARDAALPPHFSTIRVLDVALWMRHRRVAAAP